MAMGIASRLSSAPGALPGADDGTDAPILQARGITKSYPGVHALRGVDIDLVAGQVHGLVGENGAGKSTLLKVLTGVVVPDSGRIDLAGQPVGTLNPRTARRLGIAAVHQEPSVVPALSPVANVFLGHPASRAGFLRSADMRRRFREWADLLGTNVPAAGQAGALPVGAQQTIEIIRALEQGARIVLMDEPTASLGPQERRGLFRMLESMLAQGIAVVFISHKLDDVLALATTVSVLRDGERVLQVPAAGTSADTLIEAMLGKELEAAFHAGDVPSPGHHFHEPREVLRVESLAVPGVLHGVNLSVAAGEIVGIAGLVGAGRSTLLRAIGGAEPTADGVMRIDGREVPWPRTPRHARLRGVALAPEDRRTQGLVLSLSAGENMMLAEQVPRTALGVYRQRMLYAAARDAAEKVGFAPGRVRASAGTLSGGNQQKLIIGRLARNRPKVLLLDEPGRGIDIGAKAEIFRLIRALARSGVAVVVVSEEIEEVIALAARVVVLADATLSESLTGEDITMERVLSRMLPARASREVGAGA